MVDIEIYQVRSRAARRAFVNLPFQIYKTNTNWVPPIRSEIYGLISPKRNPWFEHGKAQLFVAKRANLVVGRISAHIDDLALTQPESQGLGPGTGFWGLLEADSAETVYALLKAAECWLQARGATKIIGPFNLSYWDEIGLLVDGFNAPATVMMGFNSQDYAGWVSSCGYRGIEETHTYEVPLENGFPELCNKLVADGERNDRIRIRKVDKARFSEETAIIVNLINEAWSRNWGFVPFTDAEVKHAARKLRPLVFETLIRVAELDGTPVAFMMALPDVNERIRSFNGNLLPLNWLRLALWLRNPRVTRMRVPLMGVASHLHGTRLASQLALMLVEYIRREAVIDFGAQVGDFGWVLASNSPMRSVANGVGGRVNRTYRIYGKQLATEPSPLAANR